MAPRLARRKMLQAKKDLNPYQTPCAKKHGMIQRYSEYGLTYPTLILINTGYGMNSVMSNNEQSKW